MTRKRTIGRPIGTELIAALQLLAESEEDSVIAEYLRGVIDNVQRYSTEPTKDQMQGALWDAELQVVHRLAGMEDRLLAAIQTGTSRTEELRGTIDALQATFQEVAETVNQHGIILEEHDRELKETKRRRKQVDDAIDTLKARIEELHTADAVERNHILETVTQIQAWLQPYIDAPQNDRAALLEQHQRNTDNIARILQRLGMDNA